MQMRRVGQFEVSAIGFGCMGLSHGYGPATEPGRAAAVLTGALDAGYRFFDTAAIYGMGRNETLAGEVLGPRRADYVLASKCGLSLNGKREMNGRPEILKATCEESLRNLKTDVIDLYYLHRWDQRVPIEESVGALGELVGEGKIRAVGLSEVSAPTLRRAHATYPITALQTEYSPWTRNPEIAVLDACRELGVAFVAFSPVGRGLLAGGVGASGEYAANDMRAGMPRFLGEALQANLKLFAAFAELAREAGCTPAQLCLAWLLQKDPIIVPIPGTTSPDHLRENAAAADIRLSADIVQRLETLVNARTVTGDRYASTVAGGVETERFPGEG